MISDLQRKKAALEEALSHTSLALGHDDYVLPFRFTRPAIPPKSHFKNETLLKIIAKCESRNLGFDPDLFLQHVEKEALERFNETVLSELEGRPVQDLMEMRHECELFLLKDRHEFHLKELDKVDRALLGEVTGVSIPSRDANLPDRQNVIATIGVDKKKKKK